MITKTAMTVTQLNTYIKMLFEGDYRLKNICIVGEISNFVCHYKTGHCYFSLKDEASSIKAVMFAASAKLLKFEPENGMRVYVTGRISVFERDGVYQIYAQTMEPEGAGALMLAYEQLKSKLQKEGLFDEDRKKEIPKMPKKIAVITSPGGAAIQDIINVISRRYPLCELIICPAAVQGVSCGKENADMIDKVNEREDIDTIIIARGGGSAEDLWGYNDESLVYAVARSRIPIISGVGHETDFSLCDLAADLRAPTPSAAAEISVPDIYDLYQHLDAIDDRLSDFIDDYFLKCQNAILNIQSRISLLNPSIKVERQSVELKNLDIRLNAATNKIISNETARQERLSARLAGLNPYDIIAKGYIPVILDGKSVKSAKELSLGDRPILKFADGDINCEIL